MVYRVSCVYPLPIKSYLRPLLFKFKDTFCVQKGAYSEKWKSAAIAEWQFVIPRFLISLRIREKKRTGADGTPESLERVGNIHLLLKRDVEHAVASGSVVKSIVTDSDRSN